MRIIILVKVDVLEIEGNSLEKADVPSMSSWRYIDYSEWGRFDQFIPKQVCEVKMTEMIDGPVHFCSFLCQLPRRNAHNSCVVDQKIYFLCIDGIWKFLDWCFGSKIEINKFNLSLAVDFLNLLDRLLSILPIPCSNNNTATHNRKFFNNLEPDPSIPARHHSYLALQIYIFLGKYRPIHISLEKIYQHSYS